MSMLWIYWAISTLSRSSEIYSENLLARTRPRHAWLLMAAAYRVTSPLPGNKQQFLATTFLPAAAGIVMCAYRCKFYTYVCLPNNRIDDGFRQQISRNHVQ